MIENREATEEIELAKRKFIRAEFRRLEWVLRIEQPRYAGEKLDHTLRRTRLLSEVVEHRWRNLRELSIRLNAVTADACPITHQSEQYSTANRQTILSDLCIQNEATGGIDGQDTHIKKAEKSLLDAELQRTAVLMRMTWVDSNEAASLRKRILMLADKKLHLANAYLKLVQEFPETPDREP